VRAQRNSTLQRPNRRGNDFQGNKISSKQKRELADVAIPIKGAWVLALVIPALGQIHRQASKNVRSELSLCRALTSLLGSGRFFNDGAADSAGGQRPMLATM